jgi:hypothetical protein
MGLFVIVKRIMQKRKKVGSVQTATPTRKKRTAAPMPPAMQAQAVIEGDMATIQRWLTHYWQKLSLPDEELKRLAMTQDRRQFKLWTGKRLHPLILGCYCYLPARVRGEDTGHRHLIFIEPDMQPQSIEVTIAHELIHLADRVRGTPRRHRHHGYDSIAADEAAVTGYPLEELRTLLREESAKRERVRRELRPLRYLYVCPNCGKKYPRARKYSHAVSCSSCDQRYNPRYRLILSSYEATLLEEPSVSPQTDLSIGQEKEA